MPFGAELSLGDFETNCLASKNFNINLQLNFDGLWCNWQHV